MNKQINTPSSPENEFEAKNSSGMFALFAGIILLILSVVCIVLGFVLIGSSPVIGVILLTIGFSYSCIMWPISLAGLKVIKPNEAMVLTLFGKYIGTLRKEGFYYINPFARPVPPPNGHASSAISVETAPQSPGNSSEQAYRITKSQRTISLKVMTLNNEKQKINDALGNPIIIGIVVIWKVTNPVKAVFNVDNYPEFLSIQCDSALRNIVRLYPYDSSDEGTHEKSLRGSSQEIAEKVCKELQDKVEIAGLEIMEARITHLAYAPEIAAAMLQRQQASAIVDARQLIVEGAVGMVEMALEKLSVNQVVELDEERKAAMVSNLLVVLCGNRDAQPVVNSGSLY